jgi:hypothetical protein
VVPQLIIQDILLFWSGENLTNILSVFKKILMVFTLPWRSYTVLLACMKKTDRFYATQNPTKDFHACLLKGTYDVHSEKNLLF